MKMKSTKWSLSVKVNRAEVAITRNQTYIEHFANLMHLRWLSHSDRKIPT